MKRLVEAFWVADAMVLGLILFFAIVGGALLSSPFFAVAAGASAVLLLVHGFGQRRARQQGLTHESQKIRERRGF